MASRCCPVRTVITASTNAPAAARPSAVPVSRSGHHDDPGFGTADLPDLSTDLVRRARGRNSDDARHEREAELNATIIMEWASVVDYAARALGASLDDRPGWL